MRYIDLNGDVGEGTRVGAVDADQGLMPYLTSANIACGFHAGDAATMRATVALALEHGVAIGAHPGFPDPQGFGRRELYFSPSDVEDFVSYQIGQLSAIAATAGVRLQHVKPHGALFNMAARDAELADAVARAAAVIDRELILFGLPGSELVAAGVRSGLRTAAEGFADRAYNPDGTLVARNQPGAVLRDASAVIPRVVRMAREHMVEAADGTSIPLEVDTICVHGDTPGAADLASQIRAALCAAGVEVTPVGRMR
jgi:5-oxoprolinase (ATP-hydrolysing) subunit A